MAFVWKIFYYSQKRYCFALVIALSFLWHAAFLIRFSIYLSLSHTFALWHTHKKFPFAFFSFNAEYYYGIFLFYYLLYIMFMDFYRKSMPKKVFIQSSISIQYNILLSFFYIYIFFFLLFCKIDIFRSPLVLGGREW